jgi:hypothetical protein
MEAAAVSTDALSFSPLAQHSTASPDWGSPALMQLFATYVLKPAAIGATIDLDYASSSYWHDHWPKGTRPASYLDGSPGRDVLIEADRRAAVRHKNCGAGFQNPPGLEGGRMIQRCWAAMEEDHRNRWLDSGFWVGFSIEQFASLQGITTRNPLTVGTKDLVTTIIPSRRARYQLHPEAYIAVLQKKQGRRVKGCKEWIAEQKLIDQLRDRKNDAPVTPPAPPHSSYVSILWSHKRDIRRKQMAAARGFLKAQAAVDKSLFQEVAIVGEISA